MQQDQVLDALSEGEGQALEEENYLAPVLPNIMATRWPRFPAGSSLRRADYEHVLFDWPKIPPSYCYRCPWGKTYPSCDIDCANALEDEIKKQGAGDNIAAFIAEPMMGASGGAVPPVKEYWPRLRESSTRNDILLIADEVMTGFGRTGRRFAVDHCDEKPDILIGGKGLTGGYMP